VKMLPARAGKWFVELKMTSMNSGDLMPPT
jgi:hypothetical protein